MHLACSQSGSRANNDAQNLPDSPHLDSYQLNHHAQGDDLRSPRLGSFRRVLVADLRGLGRSPPSEPQFSCDDIAGSYDATFSNSCGGFGIVILAQVGCTFSGLIPGFGGGTIAGQINGRTATFTLFFAAPCSGSASGTATVSRTAISGTFTGGATGFGCCNSVSGSFVLTR
jgi:hypothetical protein